LAGQGQEGFQTPHALRETGSKDDDGITIHTGVLNAP
jgi:hypothetical protein